MCLQGSHDRGAEHAGRGGRGSLDWTLEAVSPARYPCPVVTTPLSRKAGCLLSLSEELRTPERLLSQQVSGPVYANTTCTLSWTVCLLSSVPLAGGAGPSTLSGLPHMLHE